MRSAYFPLLLKEPWIKLRQTLISEHSQFMFRDISGAKLREMLKNKEIPSNWFMRPEIATYLIDKVKDGSQIFVE